MDRRYYKATEIRLFAAITVLSRLSFYAYSANRSVLHDAISKRDIFGSFCILSKNSFLEFPWKTFVVVNDISWRRLNVVFAKCFRTATAIHTNVHAVSSGSNSGRKLLKLPLHLLCKINKVCLLLEQLCSFTLVTEWKNLQCLLNEPYLFLTFLVSYLRSAAEYNVVFFYFPKNFFIKCTSVSIVEMFYNSHFIHTLLFSTSV